jgi:hypothetical protein
VTVNVQHADFGSVRLWDNDHPNMYDVVTTVTVGGQSVHDFTPRIGFREALFQNDTWTERHRILKPVSAHITHSLSGTSRCPRTAERIISCRRAAGHSLTS